MTSVTRVTHRFKQPYGGVIKVKEFITEQYDDEIIFNPEESLSPGTVGLVTQYLTEFMLGINKEKVFNISIYSAMKIVFSGPSLSYLEKIEGLDDESILNACKLSGYDVVYRAGTQ